MLMATSRRRNLGVGVAGVLNLNLLSFGALDLCSDVGSVGGERGQTNVPTVLLQRKGETTSEEKGSKNKSRQDPSCEYLPQGLVSRR